MSAWATGAWKVGAWYGTAWFVSGTPPTPEEQPIRNFSLNEWRRWHRPDDEEELAKRGIEPAAAEVIAVVAERQVSNPSDEQKRLDELRGELMLAHIEMQSRHIKALADERQALLDEMNRTEQDQIAMLALLAAAV